METYCNIGVLVGVIITLIAIVASFCFKKTRLPIIEFILDIISDLTSKDIVVVLKTCASIVLILIGLLAGYLIVLVVWALVWGLAVPAGFFYLTLFVIGERIESMSYKKYR